MTADASDGSHGRSSKSSSIDSVGCAEALRLPGGMTGVTRDGMVDIMASQALCARAIVQTCGSVVSGGAALVGPHLGHLTVVEADQPDEMGVDGAGAAFVADAADN